ncbi:inactive heparanase-2 [Strix aluco]|uniref:inactive heparanase-2 n=1 Tax=Strix aluco TaxID=111821 RepID=UPI003DA4C6A1
MSVTAQELAQEPVFGTGKREFRRGSGLGWGVAIYKYRYRVANAALPGQVCEAGSVHAARPLQRHQPCGTGSPTEPATSEAKGSYHLHDIAGTTSIAGPQSTRGAVPPGDTRVTATAAHAGPNSPQHPRGVQGEPGGWRPSGLTLLELLKQRVEARVVEDAVERAAVEAGDSLQGGAVIGVDKSQVLDEEQPERRISETVVKSSTASARSMKQSASGVSTSSTTLVRSSSAPCTMANSSRTRSPWGPAARSVSSSRSRVEKTLSSCRRAQSSSRLSGKTAAAHSSTGSQGAPRGPPAAAAPPGSEAQSQPASAALAPACPSSSVQSSSRRLVTLARGLAPAFLRFAGKRTDFLQFHNVKNPAKSRGGPGPDYYLKNYEDARSLDKLYNFADCSGLHLIFALNALRRNPNNSWNSSNALSLLKYSASKKYNISWELGNEPNNYRTLIGRSVNGSQLGKDYIQLRSLLQLIRTYSRANLYGPNIGRPRKNVIALLEGFMKVAGSTVDAVTWQHYYIDGRVAKVTDFLKTRLLDTLSDQIRKIQKVVNTYTPGKKIWLEGVGATSAGGMNNLSDSYAAGFLWLNTLGLLASRGIDVVVRHSFLDHGHNHLVDQNFNPLPDYWLSLLYKRLIGPKVLAIHVAGLQRKPRPGRVIRDKLRIYAHCTSYHNHNYVRGSITLYIINLHRSRKKIKLAGTLRDKIVHQYLLQPYGKDGLHSKSVQLNGQPLAMVDDGTLPELKPRPLRAGRTLVIPPLTMSFYVVKNVNALACRYR